MGKPSSLMLITKNSQIYDDERETAEIINPYSISTAIDVTTMSILILQESYLASDEIEKYQFAFTFGRIGLIGHGHVVRMQPGSSFDYGLDRLSLFRF